MKRFISLLIFVFSVIFSMQAQNLVLLDFEACIAYDFTKYLQSKGFKLISDTRIETSREQVFYAPKSRAYILLQSLNCGTMEIDCELHYYLKTDSAYQQFISQSKELNSLFLSEQNKSKQPKKNWRILGKGSVSRTYMRTYWRGKMQFRDADYYEVLFTFQSIVSDH